MENKFLVKVKKDFDKNSKIAAGSLVLKNVPKNKTIAGIWKGEKK